MIPFENSFLSEILLLKGYTTYAVGKWHLTPGHESSAAGPSGGVRKVFVKFAKLGSGEQVTASEYAPHQAIYPLCGCKVVLRKRKKMSNSELTYCWCHIDGKNTNCLARWKPRS